MARFFAPITVDELRTKIEAAGLYENNFSPGELVEKLSRDLKAEFDLENFSMEEDSFGPEGLMGFKTLSNGMTFCGMAAGGDWEFPIFFIVYWDGKKLRGYVPTEGNPWNTYTGRAFGNDEEFDLKNAKDRWPQELAGCDCVDPTDFDYVEEKIQNDILDRIVPKPENVPEKDVHTEHCCVLHGCKYGNDDCPVQLGDKKQSFPCETCDADGIKRVPDPDDPHYDVLSMNDNELRDEVIRLRKAIVTLAQRQNRYS
jgi:hypothetical protein